ncbi:Lipoprotein signal peptidase [Candidatus Gugararchaeum adminiculabundum]|nr:Lipoprotein signal peptidase [Candidatus Gugararchaeum adminiculabundum]
MYKQGLSQSAREQLQNSFFQRHVEKITLALVPVAVIVFDRMTKKAVNASISIGAEKPVTKWFSLTNYQNTAFAHNLLANIPAQIKPYIPGVGLAVIGGLYWCYYKPKTFASNLGFALFASGGLANFLERTSTGAVTDFLTFKLPLLDKLFKNFNVADVAAIAGIALLAVDYMLQPVRERKRAAAEGLPNERN